MRLKRRHMSRRKKKKIKKMLLIGLLTFLGITLSVSAALVIGSRSGTAQVQEDIPTQ